MPDGRTDFVRKPTAIVTCVDGAEDHPDDGQSRDCPGIHLEVEFGCRAQCHFPEGVGRNPMLGRPLDHRREPGPLLRWALSVSFRMRLNPRTLEPTTLGAACRSPASMVAPRHHVVGVFVPSPFTCAQSRVWSIVASRRSVGGREVLVRSGETVPGRVCRTRGLQPAWTCTGRGRL